MKCEMTAVYNPDGSHKKGGCDEEATTVLKGKMRTWHLCKEHYKQCAEFIGEVKTALGEKNGIDGYA
jgi:hypothetical protein